MKGYAFNGHSSSYIWAPKKTIASSLFTSWQQPKMAVRRMSKSESATRSLRSLQGLRRQLMMKSEASGSEKDTTEDSRFTCVNYTDYLKFISLTFCPQRAREMSVQIDFRKSHSVHRLEAGALSVTVGEEQQKEKTRRKEMSAPFICQLFAACVSFYRHCISPFCIHNPRLHYSFSVHAGDVFLFLRHQETHGTC